MDIKASMKVNLMRQDLHTRISSPQLSSDGYCITNLLSDSHTGFLVEYFMKPPVFIDIEFMCNMYIHEIAINTRLGTQKSKGIEILVNESTVGKCYLDANQDIVQWVRNRHIHESPNNANVFVSEFYSGAHRHLSSTKKIRLKIFKTENSSLVALRSLKIFGSVNKRTNEPEVTNTFVHLIQDVFCKPVSNFSLLHRVSENSTENKILHTTNSEISPNLVEIPEDFLDPITHEFMTNPIILPSGKIIDKSTLDKYVDNELKWNRLPNDPFTNVKFSSHQKPMQALQLKSRIDKFLLLNRNHPEIEKLPRTLQDVYRTKPSMNLLFKVLKNNDRDYNETSMKDDCLKRRKSNSCYELGVTDEKKRRLDPSVEIDVKSVQTSTRRLRTLGDAMNSLKPTPYSSTGSSSASHSQKHSIGGETHDNKLKHKCNIDTKVKPSDSPSTIYPDLSTSNKVEILLDGNETIPTVLGVHHSQTLSTSTSDTELASSTILTNLEDKVKEIRTIVGKNVENPIAIQVDHEIVDLTDEPLSETIDNTESDLDHKILNSLKYLPSYISHTPVNSCSESHTVCFNCEDNKLLYRVVTCQHHICRVCLSSKKVSECKLCQVAFSSGDVIRIFNS